MHYFPNELSPGPLKSGAFAPTNASTGGYTMLLVKRCGVQACPMPLLHAAAPLQASAPSKGSRAANPQAWFAAWADKSCASPAHRAALRRRKPLRRIILVECGMTESIYVCIALCNHLTRPLRMCTRFLSSSTSCCQSFCSIKKWPSQTLPPQSSAPMPAAMTLTNIKIATETEQVRA